jgi:hypothetical protein
MLAPPQQRTDRARARAIRVDRELARPDGGRRSATIDVPLDRVDVSGEVRRLDACVAPGDHDLDVVRLAVRGTRDRNGDASRGC